MYRVIIVDDEKPAHVAIRELINWSKFGLYEPRSAYNGKEGLALIASIKPHIVFLDMNMPYMSGVDFLEIATKSHSDCQFIVVSGYDSFQYAKAAIRFGVVDYLLKPIDHNELDRVLRNAVSRLPERAIGLEDFTVIEATSAVREFIDRHYQEDINVEEIAEKHFISKEYLTRVFRNTFGCPVYEYVLRVRMEKGKELLNDPNLTVQKIAEMIGYNNSNHFCKAFRRRFGCTPAEYRNSQE